MQTPITNKYTNRVLKSHGSFEFFEDEKEFENTTYIRLKGDELRKAKNTAQIIARNTPIEKAFQLQLA